MPVRKFRAVEEMPAFQVSPPGGDNLRAAADLSALCQRLHPWVAPRGVFRNTSIEEAQERRRRWETSASPG
ncbi:MAG: hypothetical protein ACRD0K_06325 [Egibacteraceae bacterium]